MLRLYARAGVRTLYPEGANEPGGEDAMPVLNARGDLLIAQALPPITECVRLGRSYSIRTVAAAPVAAIPTTTAALAIWNGEPDGGRCYIIQSVFGIAVTSTAATNKNFAIVGQLNIGRKASPTTNLVNPLSLVGQAYSGRAFVNTAQAVTNDSAWQALGSSFVEDTATAGIASTWEHPQNGRIIIPPGHLFGISCIVTAVATTTCRIGIRWHEVQMPVGPQGWAK